MCELLMRRGDLTFLCADLPPETAFLRKVWGTADQGQLGRGVRPELRPHERNAVAFAFCVRGACFSRCRLSGTV